MGSREDRIRREVERRRVERQEAERQAVSRRRRGWVVRCAIGVAILVLAIATFAVWRSRDSTNETDAPLAAAKSKVAASEARSRHIKRLEAKLSKQRAQQAQREREVEQQAASGSAGLAESTSSKDFNAFASGLGGEVGLAYVPIGSGGSSPQTLGPLQSGSAWSTIKVPIAEAVIEDGGGPSSLDASTTSEISAALRNSDNAAAESLWGVLVSTHGGASGAAEAVQKVLAMGGDSSTTVSTVGRDGFSPYGQTEWALASQATFMASLAAGCLQGSSYLLEEMGQVSADQRWGLGTAGSQAFKGGWGPGSSGGYLVRQMGTLNGNAVAIAALPSDGTFGSGTQMLDQLAQWGAANLPQSSGGRC